MEGVEILNTVWVMPQWLTAILVSVSILSIILIFICLCADSSVGVFIFGTLFISTVIAGNVISVNQWMYVPQYEATISDEVNFIELNEKYKIIKQRGQIYVLEERNVT